MTTFTYMKFHFIFTILIFANSIAVAQDITWSSNRPQNTLIEDCGEGEFILTNQGDVAVDLSIDLSGNYDEADIATDVLSTITLQAGNAYSFTIEALADNMEEANENVVISVICQ